MIRTLHAHDFAAVPISEKTGKDMSGAAGNTTRDSHNADLVVLRGYFGNSMSGNPVGGLP